jgi:hypothetical protein
VSGLYIEALLVLDDIRVVLQLDGLAERERHRRQACGPQGGSPGLTKTQSGRDSKLTRGLHRDFGTS